MAIEEIPIDAGETPEPEEAEASLEEEVPESPAPEPAPKRRGRPLGAKNRAKPKAAPPPPVIKRQRSRRPPTPESSSSEDEEPPPRRRAQPQRAQPAEDPMRVMAAEMLHLMQHQSMGRQQARANKYASWFPRSEALGP